MTFVFICFDSFGFVAAFSLLRERMRTRRCVDRVWEELGEGNMISMSCRKLFKIKALTIKRPVRGGKSI